MLALMTLDSPNWCTMRDLFDNQLRWLIEATVPAHLRPGAAPLTPSQGRIAFALGSGALIIWLLIAPSLKLSNREVLFTPFLWGSLSGIVMGLGHGLPVLAGLSRSTLQIARVLWGIALVTTPIYVYRFFLS